MNRREERRWWLGAALATLSGVVGSVAARPEPRAIPVEQDTTPRAPVDGQGLASVAQLARVIARNPFRTSPQASRPPAAVAPDAASAPPDAAALRLRLTGLVGPPWRAILEGAPGLDGAVLLSPGDSLGSVRVIAIGPDSVVIRDGGDARTLHLTRSRQ